ncbi:hypothetical protein ACUVZB_000502 [Citrobacter freundii]|uniref:hypothetical protein n=1 Tax=Citrobacter freundii TaxID=546 RepID=UPI00177D7693|nr:hypothetical protein [Citrobacter freundii]MBD9989719.1 hypothetical protein [Citrobacter freundii]MBE0053618.1 hypothetical protein [Citrobacter freundii]MDT7287919.1 hypothetical protein [Citrobacter freundii]HBU6166844.1 hypothetical protein [Citrobacter freundii]HBV8018951.1 hypothetical protein [Citrobacter freundii]
MVKTKIDHLKQVINSDDFLSLSFEDIIKFDNNVQLLEDLIYLVGYNIIFTERTPTGTTIFSAGMFANDLDEKIRLDNNHIEGKLLLAIKTVFNIILEMKKLPNVVDLYSTEMIVKLNNAIAKNNKVDILFLNLVRNRLNN